MGEGMASGQAGYIVIGDITGYTRFLSGSELDHARGILEDLFEVLTTRLTAPLVLSHIQGDAILAHAPKAQVANGGLVLDAVEALYIGFREKLALMEINTTCRCAACASISGLDLKFVVHFGEYVEHDLGGNRELSGSDVIVAHRLLKNDVTQETGIAAYALFTEAAISEMGLATVFDKAPRYHLDDPDLGVIETRALDMGPRWQRYSELSHVMVDPGTKLFIPEITRTIAASPDVVWHYYLDPTQRPRWFVGVVGLERESGGDGRLAPGSRDHCAHGGGKVSINTFVDVVPHHHVTYDLALPMQAYARITVLMEPHEAGTRLTVRVADAVAPGPLRTAWLRLVGRLFLAKGVAEDWRRSLDNLATLIASEGPTAGA
jgi:uncharacterized protein YndB with AHSA1/START domain